MDGNSILFIVWFISLGIALLVGNISGGWTEAMLIGVGGFVVGLIASNIYEALTDQKLATQRQYDKEHEKAEEEENASFRRKLAQAEESHIITAKNAKPTPLEYADSTHGYPAEPEWEECIDFTEEYPDETFSSSAPARSVASKAETSSKSKTNDIAEVIARRKVTELVHFTRIENVRSIMSNGFVARDKLSSVSHHAIVNDKERFDGNLGATSFSVSFPNWRYFYTKVCENKNAKWAVISVKPSVLLDDKLKSIYFNTNAASSAARECTFDEMFGASQDNYPEDAQAEIQIFGTILPKYIREVYVKDNADKIYLERSGIRASVQPQYFYKREKDK